MNMGIESRIQFLIQNFRDSRKTILIPALAAAIVAILIFIGGSYFFLFNYYEELHQSYYGAILRDVSSFQSQLIGMNTYRDDMRNLAHTIQRYRGVMNVWFTDRYGRLIYHTDSTVLGEYRARRLPTEYYESIEHLWEYEEGYPLMHTVPLSNRLTMRLSLPLYITGREEHDFIIGLDVRRFLFIPHDTRSIIFLSAGYFLLALIILFLPLLFLVRLRLREAESQARMIIGPALPLSGGGVPPAGLTVEQPAPAAVEPEWKVQEPPAQQAAPEPKQEAPSASGIASEEIEQEKKLIAFLKQKRTLFAEQDVDNDFLQAHNYALHSKGAEGSYVLYHGIDGSHLFACFSVPAGKPPDVYEKIVDTAVSMRSSLKVGSKAIELLKAANDFCRKGKMDFEVSVILIDEKNKSTEYSCSGAGKALYLKEGEGKTKELLLENPKLGSLPSNDFVKQLSSADLKLSKNDLFSLPAQNAAMIQIDDANLETLIRDDLVKKRAIAAKSIGNEIVKKFESLDLAAKNNLPESGFVIVKFK